MVVFVSDNSVVIHTIIPDFFHKVPNVLVTLDDRLYVNTVIVIWCNSPGLS